jgi:hypothetical protein
MATKALVLALLSLGLLLAGCGNRSGRMFNRLYESDFGLGVRFELSQAQVRAVLGEPTASSEVQGEISVTDHYLPQEVIETDSDTPQMALTYLEGVLVRLFNRWHPDDPEQPAPPIYMEPLSGVKLGNRKSAFVDALGPPTDPIAGNEWRFEHKDGRKIMVTATFTEIPNTEDQLCSVLQIVLIPAEMELAGEQAEENADWRQRVGIE